MLDLKKCKNDNYSYYFYKTKINTFSNYFNKINDFLLSNIDNCDHLYIIHPFNVFNLHLLTLNSLYLYENEIKNNNKKIIVLHDSNSLSYYNCDIYNNINKINVSYLYHHNDYYDDNYNLLITSVDHFYNFLIQGDYKNNFNNNHKYIFILDLSIPFYETYESNVFDYLKHYNVDYKLLMHSNYLNNKYKNIIHNTNQNILINNYFDNNSLNKIHFFNSNNNINENDSNKFDYFNYLLEKSNISNCLIYVDFNDYDNFRTFLYNNDIQVHNLSLHPFKTIHPNFNHRFYIVHNIHDFTKNLYFFEKGILYSHIECILKHKDFIFHINEEKKDIYLFNSYLKNDIASFYNINPIII